MSKDGEFWSQESSDSWDNQDNVWGDDGSWGDEEDVIDIEYEVDDDDITVEKAENVNSRRRKIIKKSLFYGSALFFIGVGEELFKRAFGKKRRD